MLRSIESKAPNIIKLVDILAIIIGFFFCLLYFFIRIFHQNLKNEILDIVGILFLLLGFIIIILSIFSIRSLKLENDRLSITLVCSSWIQIFILLSLLFASVNQIVPCRLSFIFAFIPFAIMTLNFMRPFSLEEKNYKKRIGLWILFLILYLLALIKGLSTILEFSYY